jgi:sortase B
LKKGVKTMSDDKNTMVNNKEDNADQSPVDNINTELNNITRDSELKTPDNPVNAAEEAEKDKESDLDNSGNSVSKEETGLKENEATEPKTARKKFNLFKVIRIACATGFLVFSALFINEVFIEPYRADKAVELTRDLYVKPSDTLTTSPTEAPAATAAPTDVTEATPTPDPNRDAQGRLLTFQDLLAENEDTKGWITVPDTNIDYVVMQSSEDPEYYLTRDFNKEKQKAGSLFLDYKSSVENHTQNLVIHGHNMTSTDNMFHYLIKYKELDWYKERPVFDFNTIYQNGEWKIFAIFITNGSSQKEPLFDYTKSSFQDSAEFLNFIYQLRIRSLYQMDTVDVNENDEIVTLSTCSYEVKNYRTVIVARKVREGEDPSVDVDSVTVNPEPLYPGSWYYRYGGKAPELTATFEEALENGEINWYKEPVDGGQE